MRKIIGIFLTGLLAVANVYYAIANDSNRWVYAGFAFAWGFFFVDDIREVRKLDRKNRKKAAHLCPPPDDPEYDIVYYNGYCPVCHNDLTPDA